MNLPELDVDWLPVPFLVDTGATSTCIHPNDAVGLLKIPPARLDPANWDNGRIREAFGISGVVRFLETEAYFGFFDDRPAPIMLHSTVRIAELRPDNQYVPSLLGWDLLQHFRMILDGKARTLDFEWLG